MIKRVLNRGRPTLSSLLGMLILIIVSLLIVSFAVPARATPLTLESSAAALLMAPTPTDVYIIVAEVASFEAVPVAAVARGPDQFAPNASLEYYYEIAITAQVRADYAYHGQPWPYLRI